MAITTKSITLPDGKEYPHSFTPLDIDKLAEFIGQHDRIVLLRDFAKGDTDTGAISIRHDVDHSAEHAVRFAEWEAARNIKASYFLLPTADYYPVDAKEAAIRIQELGHEVGIHNDAYRVSKGNATLAVSLLRAQIGEMRAWGIQVSGCADHGGGEPNNTKMWHRLEPSVAGLDYEAYLLHKQGAHYISDNHGSWNGPLERREGRPTHLLVHPEHWELP